MTDSDRLVKYFKDHQKEYLDTLKTFVELESPTYESKEASDKCGRFLQDLFKDLGFRVKTIPQTKIGDHIVAEYGTGEKGTLLVGHYDTVYPLGTLKTMPFKIEGDKVCGPGVMDMKGGILLACFGIKALIEFGLMPKTQTTFFINSDEEPGSFLSSDLIVAEAKKHKRAIVLEPALDRLGTVKARRYGRGTYRFTAHGRSSHSGLSPREGISAIMELSQQALRIQSMNDFEKGFTLVPTCFFSGVEGTCTLPGEGWFSMDVRFRTEEMTSQKNKEILAMQAITPGCRLEVTGGIDKPPLEADPDLLNRTVELGKELGMTIEGVTVGSGSDGNMICGAGVPTLDGMGVTGKDPHNPGEYVILSHIPQRGALVARLIQTL